ncbi:MAG: DNA-binding response regulator [Bacteroidetes bacterium]|nr:MAG: DNA-binding response regulator [Bacteroidota bacterium]
MKIKCIAVDDEPLAIIKIKGYSEKIDYLDLCATFDNALDAIQYLKTNDVDLIFLDVQMEDLTGIQMLETLDSRPHIILTTAYDEYALKGYELDVCDYLLKPFPFPRFLKACEKVFAQLNVNQTNSNTLIKDGNQTPKHIFVKSGSQTFNVQLNEILYLEGMKDYVRIWTKDQNIMALLTFSKLELSLTPPDFIRIHKSYIVSVSKIDSIERNRVKIGDAILPIGDTYKKDFESLIEKGKI